MNIIECTMKMRREAQENYEKLAQAVTDNDLKRIFTMLAAAEDEHIEKLGSLNEEFKASAAPGNNLSEGVCVYNPLIDLRNPVKTLRNDPDAYKHVVKEEEDTIDFFERLAAEANDEQLRKVCTAAAEQEREYLQMVENIYAFVEEPRTYLEWGEFSNLKSL